MTVIKYIPHLLIISFLSIYLLPAFGSIDKISPQFMLLSMTSLLGFVYIFLNDKLKIDKTNIKSLIFYILFILSALVSILWSYNKIESFVVLNQYLVYLYVFLILSFLFRKINNPNLFFYNLVLFILSIEVFYITIQLFNLLDTFSFQNFNRTNEIKGVAGNINIAAFSICYKLPIIIFSKYRFTWYKFLLVFLSIFLIFLMGSRGAYLAYFFILLGYFIFLILKKGFNLKSNILKLCSLILPLIFSFLVLNNSNIDVAQRASTISLNTQDGSVNQRLRYYTHAIESFIENPLGIGVGNWKIKSIEYDKKNIFQYIIPYHAHNDYLQILAEQGIFGVLIFLIFLFSPIFRTVKLGFKNILKQSHYLMAMFIYILDSLFNFPIARPINAVFLLSVMVLVNHNTSNSQLKLDDSKKKIAMFFLIIITSLSIFINIKHFISFRFQSFLIGEWTGSQLKIPLGPIKEFDESIPNLSATGIPLSAMKGRYFLRDGKNQEALNYFNKAEKENGTIAISDNLKSQFYFQRKNIDSAYFYAKRAFEKLPNNTIHASVYFDILSLKGQKEELYDAFEKVTLKEQNVSFYNSFYEALLRIEPTPNIEIHEEIQKVLLKIPDNYLKLLSKKFKLGEFNISESIRLSVLANEEFENGNLRESIKLYENAKKFDNENIEFYENLGIIYFKLDNYDSALKEFNYVLNNFKESITGKSEFYKAVILIDQNQNSNQEVCGLLKISDKKGFNGAKSIIDTYCK